MRHDGTNGGTPNPLIKKKILVVLENTLYNLCVMCVLYNRFKTLHNIYIYNIQTELFTSYKGSSSFIL